MPEPAQRPTRSPNEGGYLFRGLLSSDRPCRLPHRESNKDSGEEILLSARPSMARGNPWLFALLVLMTFLWGLGLIGFAIWAVKIYFTVLTVTSERTILRRGVLAKHTSEVPNGAMHNVDVSQSVMDRMLDVGRIRFSSAGQDGFELDIGSMRSPYTIKSLVDRVSREGRWGRVGMTEEGRVERC